MASTICLTGGTGSFGHAVIHHLLNTEIQEIRVFSRDETKQDAMRRVFHDERLRYYLGDVRDPASLASPLKGADVVFHAAALKQVPSCEFFPEQAVATNVLGSANVLNVAQQQGVGRVVCLSTDKAVLPVNAMGMTKALMEKQVQAHARRFAAQGGPVVCCVRYGNVLYSRGSVVPLFVERLLAGLPLPITDARMTRFLLPLSQAVGLVQLALEQGQQGDTLIRKAPAASIATLVLAMGRLFGVQARTEAIGIRHGEKMHELLASSEEMAKALDLGDHWRIPMDARGLAYASREQAAPGDVAEVAAFASDNAHQMSVDEVVDMLAALPELQAVLASHGAKGFRP